MFRLQGLGFRSRIQAPYCRDQKLGLGHLVGLSIGQVSPFGIKVQLSLSSAASILYPNQLNADLYSRGLLVTGRHICLAPLCARAASLVKAAHLARVANIATAAQYSIHAYLLRYTIVSNRGVSGVWSLPPHLVYQMYSITQIGSPLMPISRRFPYSLPRLCGPKQGFVSDSILDEITDIDVLFLHWTQRKPRLCEPQLGGTSCTVPVVDSCAVP